MRPTPTRVAPVALLTAVALVGSTSPAMARAKRVADAEAPTITAITVNPSPVVLGTKAAGRTAFAVAVRATDTGGGVDRVTVGLYDPAENSGRAFRLSRTSGSAADGLWTGTLVLTNRPSVAPGRCVPSPPTGRATPPTRTRSTRTSG